MPVEVLPYNPEWSNWFEEITDPIWDIIGDLIIGIEHVGSTSIKGMSAKPCIDIDVLVADWARFPEIVEALTELGYTHVGNLGIEEREAFKYETAEHRHNLYVVNIASTAYRNHEALKKHLSENPVDFQRYINLKTELGQSSIDVNEYCVKKTELILEFLAAEGISEEEIEEIRSQNIN